MGVAEVQIPFFTILKQLWVCSPDLRWRALTIPRPKHVQLASVFLYFVIFIELLDRILIIPSFKVFIYE